MFRYSGTASARDERIRPAADPDLVVVAGIFAHYVTNTAVTFEEHPPTVEAWNGRLRSLGNQGLPFLVAERAGRVVGYAYAGPWREKPAYRHTVEDTVYIAPDARGQGVGGALLRALLDECRARELRELIAVIADTGDPASLALHRACGFVECGRLRRIGCKHGRWIDTVLLQRGLAPAS